MRERLQSDKSADSEKSVTASQIFGESGPILRTKTQPANELAQNKKITCHFFSKTFYKEKVLTIENACAVLALYINRFVSRFIVADKSGRQIAACKLALS